MRDIVRRKEIRVLKTITTDNGSEFLDDAAILASLNRELKLYYTHAYASWEKGSVENANALVRRWYPKGTDFSRVSHHAIRVLQEVINSIPRRVLDNRTAAQANASDASLPPPPLQGLDFSRPSRHQDRQDACYPPPRARFF